MNESFKDLDKTFDVKPMPVEEDTKILKKKVKPIVISNKSDDQEKDYQYARSQLYNLVEKMQESLDCAMEVAQDSNHPRAFEVVFNGAKNAADVVDKIQDLHKKMKEVEADEVKLQQNNTTTNNVFLNGTTADLMKMIKEQNKQS